LLFAAVVAEDETNDEYRLGVVYEIETNDRNKVSHIMFLTSHETVLVLALNV